MGPQPSAVLMNPAGQQVPASNQTYVSGECRPWKGPMGAGVTRVIADCHCAGPPSLAVTPDIYALGAEVAHQHTTGAALKRRSRLEAEPRAERCRPWQCWAPAAPLHPRATRRSRRDSTMMRCAASARRPQCRSARIRRRRAYRSGGETWAAGARTTTRPYRRGATPIRSVLCRTQRLRSN